MVHQQDAPLVKHSSVLAAAVKTYFEGRKDDLGIVDVFYGDQVQIPNSPTMCVAPSTVRHELRNTGMMLANTHTLDVILYDSRLGDMQDIQMSLDALAETVMDELNGLGRFSGRITYGNVDEVQYGYLVKANRLMRADRIIWTAFTSTER